MYAAICAKYFGIVHAHIRHVSIAVFTQKVSSPVTFAFFHIRITSYDLTAQQQHKKRGLSYYLRVCCLLQLVLLHLEQVLVQLVLLWGHPDDHPAEDGTDAARYRQRVPDAENFVGFLLIKKENQIINLFCFLYGE